LYKTGRLLLTNFFIMSEYLLFRDKNILDANI